VEQEILEIMVLGDVLELEIPVTVAVQILVMLVRVAVVEVVVVDNLVRPDKMDFLDLKEVTDFHLLRSVAPLQVDVVELVLVHSPQLDLLVVQEMLEILDVDFLEIRVMLLAAPPEVLDPQVTLDQ
jgi:hypothetical protein